MPENNIKSLGSYEFFGEFSSNKENNEDRFPGVLRYSPYNGLRLSYSQSDDKSPIECKRLFGVLNNGQLCTLIGPFDLSSGTSYYGKFLTRSGEHGVRYALFGGFIEEDDLIEYCDFTFNGMQEFMRPQGFINYEDFKDGVIEKSQGHDWEVEVRNKATFSHVNESLSNLIYSKDKGALADFKSGYNKVKEKHPDATFLLRNNLSFFFRFRKKVNVVTEEAILDTIKITSLFSILIAKPVFPEEINLKFTHESKRNLAVLYSLNLEQTTIDLAQEKISHHFTPLNWQDLNFEKTLNKWLDIEDAYKVISIAYRYETGSSTLNEVYGEIILYATLMEDINKSLGGKKDEKYEKPLRQYASLNLTSSLVNLFSKYNSENLGENIATLRNELAHINRHKTLINKLNINDYIKVAGTLKIIVTSHLLHQLDISMENIHKYQDRIIPSY